VITNKRPKSLFICLSLLCLVSFNFSEIQAQDKEPSKLDLATANYKLKDLERRAKLANGAPFSLGTDGQEALRRIAELHKSFPDHPDVKDLFTRAKAAVRISKGQFVDITPEMLAYRKQGEALAALVAEETPAKWQKISAVLQDENNAITEPFPTPDPKNVLFKEVENKFVLIEGIEYPAITFSQGGTPYAFAGSPSEGYYYIDTSSREFVGAYEALRRAEQDAALDLPIKWTILGQIVDVRTLIPRIGNSAVGGTTQQGWVVKPFAIYIPGVVVAYFDADSKAGGSYSGEEQVQTMVASARAVKEAPDDVKPAELVMLLVQSTQNRNYDLYLDCIDPDLQETGIQKYYMKYYFDIFVENVFQNYVTVQISKEDEIVLLQGGTSEDSIEDLFLDDDLKDKLEETSLSKIEQVKVWVQRFDERGRAVGGVAPVTLRRYAAEKGAKPNRWYIFRGWPF